MAALVLTALLLTTCARLDHAKKDLAQARAALIVPGTKRTWKQHAEAAQADLKTCRESKDALSASLDRQSAATMAAQEAGRAATAEAERQASEAKKSALAADKRARAVLAAKPGPDRCASAMAILRGNEG
jgi:hypothetical protein